VLRSDAWALLATALVGTNYSFLMYSTGGLETSLNAMLTLAALILCIDALETSTLTVPRAFLASVVVGLLPMTRPDSALIGGLTACCLLWVTLQSNEIQRRPAVLVALLAPACLIVAPWLWWKYALYGRLLPNTFYAKVGTQRSGTSLRGIAYVGWLFVSYWWLPVTLIVIGAARVRGVSLKSIFGVRKPAILLGIYVAAWLAYVVSIGGDIMEFRHLVAAIPALVILMVDLFSRALPDVRSALPAAALLLAGSVVHAALFEYYVRPEGIFSIQFLREMGDRDPNLNWQGMGRALGDALERDPTVTMAVSPAGAIPYFARARTIDMLGLNDLWVPAHGYDRQLCWLCSGHARMATMRYLMDSGVHLLIGHPYIVSVSRPAPDPEAVVRAICYNENLDYANLPADMRLLRVPVHGDVAVAAVYVKPHPRIDRLISEGRWIAQPVSRERLVRGTADVTDTGAARSRPKT
jgi:arabinofuranosyltransferase